MINESKKQLQTVRLITSLKQKMQENNENEGNLIEAVDQLYSQGITIQLMLSQFLELYILIKNNFNGFEFEYNFLFRRIEDLFELWLRHLDKKIIAKYAANKEMEALYPYFEELREIRAALLSDWELLEHPLKNNCIQE